MNEESKHALKNIGSPLEKLLEMLRHLMKDQFFGEVSITFQNGKPHTIKLYRTYKVEEL